MRAASIGALAPHWPFPIVLKSWMVYPKPVPIACGTAAALLIKAALFAALEAKDWRADARACESGSFKLLVIYTSALPLTCGDRYIQSVEHITRRLGRILLIESKSQQLHLANTMYHHFQWPSSTQKSHWH
jgi:hypothetical protein